MFQALPGKAVVEGNQPVGGSPKRDKLKEYICYFHSSFSNSIK